MRSSKRCGTSTRATGAETVDEFLFVCYINAGEALLKAEGGSLDEAKAAVEYFGQALAIHPRNRTASDARRLGGLYLDALQALARGDSEQARSQLSALVGESPSYADGQAALRLYELIVAAGRDALAAGDIPSALERFDRAQGLPVSDTSAAQQGAALAAAATPTPSHATPRNTATATPIPTPWASVLAGPVSVRSGPRSAYPSIGRTGAGSHGRDYWPPGRWRVAARLLHGRREGRLGRFALAEGQWTAQAGRGRQVCRQWRSRGASPAATRVPKSTPTQKASRRVSRAAF